MSWKVDISANELALHQDAAFSHVRGTSDVRFQSLLTLHSSLLAVADDLSGSGCVSRFHCDPIGRTRAAGVIVYLFEVVPRTKGITESITASINSGIELAEDRGTSSGFVAHHHNGVEA